MVRCPGTKNMKMKHHQKVCNVLKKALVKTAPKGVIEVVEIFENQKVGTFWGVKGKARPDIVLVVDKKWAEWVRESPRTSPQQLQKKSKKNYKKKGVNSRDKENGK